MSWMSRPDYGVIRFSGEDARNFLQGQFTNNIGDLAPGGALRAAYCTPQGRVITLLTLLCQGQDILAVLPRSLLARTAGRLGMYVLRAKVTIRDASGELAVSSSEQPATGLSAFGQVREESNSLSWLASANPPLIFRVASLPEQVSVAPFDANRAASALVRCGLPELQPATSEQFVPQMLNLDLLQAISFTKGCYTGQEIVARTQNLGRIKRRLVRLLGAGTPPGAGTPVVSDDQGVGQVVVAASVDRGFEALAVLRLETAIANDALAIEGRTVRLAEMPYPVPELASVGR